MECGIKTSRPCFESFFPEKAFSVVPPEKAAYNAAGQFEIADVAAIAEARPDEERTQELKD
jgi:hypothetical protein